MNNELVTKICNLPPELVNLIKEYVPKHKFIFTNRENYKLYHYTIKIKTNQMDNYIRCMVRMDNEYVLNVIIRENYKIWFDKGLIIYRNITFRNYLYFIINYCIENESHNCLLIINTFLKELGLGKNLHKKNVIKYIKWNN